MARKFLYAMIVLIVLVIAAAFAYRFWGNELLRRALVPSAEVAALKPVENYDDAKLWLARPAPGSDQTNATWVPDGYEAAPEPKAAVFYVHPTSFINRSAWNAPLDDASANAQAETYLRAQATAFNGAGTIWAPRYRQATFGAFLTSDPRADQAIDQAYADVEVAFAQFLKDAGDRPIILVGHSQGALHIARLLAKQAADKGFAKRVVAAYIIGWPLSLTADLPALGLPACAKANDTGCILSWQSYAEPADPSLLFDSFDASNGFTGQPRAGTNVLCTNPLTGVQDDSAPASANLGTLVQRDPSTAAIVQQVVPASCTGRGILSIGAETPELGSQVLPGNNFHVYDFALFWANIRADADRRAAAFTK